MLTLGIILFIIGCCMDSYEDNNYRAQRREEQRHRELMEALEESRKRENLPAPRTKRQVRRRIAKDVHGNILAEEITEEIIEEDDWD